MKLEGFCRGNKCLAHFRRRAITQAILLGAILLAIGHTVQAQCYYGRKDCSEADKAEAERIRKYDKPVEKDPLGNALIGGSVTGVIKGSAAAGATAATKSIAKESVKHHEHKTDHTPSQPSCWEQWTRRSCGDPSSGRMSCDESKGIYEECRVSELAEKEREKRENNALRLNPKP